MSNKKIKPPSIAKTKKPITKTGSRQKKKTITITTSSSQHGTTTSWTPSQYKWAGGFGGGYASNNIIWQNEFFEDRIDMEYHAYLGELAGLLQIYTYEKKNGTHITPLSTIKRKIKTAIADIESIIITNK